jgi:hypothetical protein
MLPLFVSGPRQHVPLLAIGTLLASSLVLRCASMDDSGGRLSQTDAAVTGEGGTGGVQIFVETGGSPSAPVDAGPTYACRPATVEKDCPSPASTCDDGSTLAFLTAATCVDGQCQWRRRTRTCAETCTRGACDSAGDASNRDAGRQCTAAASTADATAADANALATRGCDIPPSVCLGRSKMLYFVDPRCEDGACRWVAMIDDCRGGWCENGACEYNFTH